MHLTSLWYNVVLTFLCLLHLYNIVNKGGEELADQIVRKILQWPCDVSSEEQSMGKEVVYAMSGEKSGSYFLEVVFECCR